MNNTKQIDMAISFLSRAGNKLEEAKTSQKAMHNPESISSSTECIEMSLKAIFLLVTETYPKGHEFSEAEFEVALAKMPEQLEFMNFGRLYLLHKLWSTFDSVAKYGFDTFGVGPEKVFQKDEAALAIKHAEECRHAGDALLNWVRYSK